MIYLWLTNFVYKWWQLVHLIVTSKILTLNVHVSSNKGTVFEDKLEVSLTV